MNYKPVLLWSTAEQRDNNGIIAQRADAGGFTDAIERHTGENNGSAQARLCPANGKLAKQHGDLRWMNDVRAWGGNNWSGIATDPVIGSTSGAIMPFDYSTGGPFTRLEHVHVIDTAGFDYCKLYWQAKCLAYEGLAINAAGLVTDKAGVLVNRVFSDSLGIAAAGMPVVDSSDSMFSLPKMMRVNENDLPSNEFGTGSGLAGTATFTAAASDVVTLTGIGAGVGVYNGEIVSVTTSTTLPLGLAINTKYFIVQATTGSSFKLSLTSGGAAVDIQNAGTGTHTMNLPGRFHGSGLPRGVPFQWGGAETGINWNPDPYIYGAEPLFVQWKGTVYPGSGASNDEWRMYEQVRPALSFEGSTYTTGYQNASGPPGMFQLGRAYKATDDIMTNHQFTKAGDKMEVSCWLGYPNRQHIGSTGFNASVATDRGSSPPLRISGLARIALTVGATGASWYGESADSRCWEQSDRGTPQFTYLQSTPVGGAAAPRGHFRGRLWAVLFN